MALFDILQKGVISPIFGDSSEQDAAAKAALDKALAQYTDIQTPQLSTVDLNEIAPTEKVSPTYQGTPSILQNSPQISYGDVDPQLYQALMQSQSGFNDISLDPRYKDAQDQSLSALQDIIAGGGLNSQDRSNLAKIQSDVNAEDRGRREAIMQNMAMRGQSGGGLGLLAQLQGAQDASTRQSQSDLDVASQAQARQLDAIIKSGAMGQSFGQQQFGQQADIAKANDIINQFNTANQNQSARYNADTANTLAASNAASKYAAQVGNRNAATDTAKFNIGNQASTSVANAGIANQAAAYNSTAAQTLAKQNADIANQQNMYNAGLPQQEYQNQLSKAAGASGQYGNIASDQARQAEDKNRQVAQYIDATMKAIQAGTQSNKKPEGGQ